MDAVLAAQLETMVQDLGEIREIRTGLMDLRRLVEALTGMVEGLMATRRLQSVDPEEKVTSGEHEAPVENTGEPGTAGDDLTPETAESTPSVL